MMRNQAQIFSLNILPSFGMTLELNNKLNRIQKKRDGPLIHSYDDDTFISMVSCNFILYPYLQLGSNKFGQNWALFKQSFVISLVY